MIFRNNEVVSNIGHGIQIGETVTGTRTLVFTQEQIRLISQWATNAWHDADQARLMARIDSPQEKAHLADQQFIEQIQSKLR